MGNIAKQFWVYNAYSSPCSKGNVGNFLIVNFILFFFEGDIDSDINITQLQPPLPSPLPLSMTPGRFEAKENSV